MFDVLVLNQSGVWLTFAAEIEKRQAKKIVKDLRKKGRKAQFVTSKGYSVDELAEEMAFSEED